MTSLTPSDAALIAEACSKSGVLWVRTVESTRRYLAWHVWHADAVHVVYGIEEQTLPLMSGQVEVVVPSKDSHARLVTFVAQAELLPARSPEWEAAADALSAARLNTRDPDRQRDRWASGTLITRLVPVYLTSSGAGNDLMSSGALPPAESGATSLGEYQPWHLRGRAGARRVRRGAAAR